MQRISDQAECSDDGHMHSRFSIEVDRPRDLVLIVLTGLFVPEDMSAFLEARRQAHAKLACTPGQHITLTDLRSVRYCLRRWSMPGARI